MLKVLCILFKIKKTKRQFENIAFHRSVNMEIKQKIESISELSEKAGFTCFDWFLLDSHTALKVGASYKDDSYSVHIVPSVKSL